MSAKIIEIRKQNLMQFIYSFFIGFFVLFGLEHFGSFGFDYDYNVDEPVGVKPSLTVSVPYSTKLREITFHTFFGNQVKTGGNGFTIADMALSGGEFRSYTVKSYYYTKAVVGDYIYGVYISLGLFFILIFFSTIKFKII
jgi:hypothetical protein